MIHLYYLAIALMTFQSIDFLLLILLLIFYY